MTLNYCLFKFLGWILQPGEEHKKVVTEVERSTVGAKFGCGFMSSYGSAKILCCVQGNRQESSETCWQII